VIGIAGYGLHLAAHQQRILVRNEKTAVERDLRPAARRHERVVQRAAGVEGERGSVAQREAGFAIGTDGANLARRGAMRARSERRPPVRPASAMPATPRTKPR